MSANQWGIYGARILFRIIFRYRNVSVLVYRGCSFDVFYPSETVDILTDTTFSSSPDSNWESSVSFDMSTATNRPLLVSADIYSSVSSIIALVVLVITIFGVVARLLTRFAISKTIKTHDLLITVGLVREIAESTVHFPNQGSDSKHRIWDISLYRSRQGSRPAYELVALKDSGKEFSR